MMFHRKRCNALRLLHLTLHSLTSGKAKAKVFAAKGWNVAESRTKVPAGAGPRAAAQHAIGTRFWSSWIDNRLRRIISVPILAPFPYVAVHLMQSPVVARQLLHRYCLFSIIALAAIVIRIVAVEIHALSRSDRPN